MAFFMFGSKIFAHEMPVSARTGNGMIAIETSRALFFGGCTMSQKKTYSPETQKPEIIKDDNWNPIYLNKYGNETETFRTRLGDFMMTPLKQMESLVNMISDDDYGNFGFVCEALIAANIMKIQKACELIEEAMGGRFFIDTPLRTELTYDGGTPIGVLCKPEQEVAA